LHHLIAHVFYHANFIQILHGRLSDFYFKSVTESFQKRIFYFPAKLKSCMGRMLIKTISNERDREIVLLPLWFYSAINSPAGVSRDFLVRLGSANLYGWMAYDIYDDFLDDEGRPCNLPVAIICLREVVNIYNHVLQDNQEFAEFFGRIMDRIDAANSWEQGSARISIVGGKFKVPAVLPDFSIQHLSDRSIGHALGPIAILYSLGYNKNSPEVLNILSFFECYLAARQLGDDAHDWWEDLENGFLNSSSTLVLKYFGSLEINLNIHKNKLHQIFWFRALPEILQTIFSYLSSCRQLLAHTKLIKHPQKFNDMLKALELSAQKTVRQREKIMAGF